MTTQDTHVEWEDIATSRFKERMQTNERYREAKSAKRRMPYSTLIREVFEGKADIGT